MEFFFFFPTIPLKSLHVLPWCRWRKNADKEDACAPQDEDVVACGSAGASGSDDDLVFDDDMDGSKGEESYTSICELSDDDLLTPLPLRSHPSTSLQDVMPRASGHVDGDDESAPLGKGKHWAAQEEWQDEASGHKRKRVVCAASDSDD